MPGLVRVLLLVLIAVVILSMTPFLFSFGPFGLVAVLALLLLAFVLVM